MNCKVRYLGVVAACALAVGCDVFKPEEPAVVPLRAEFTVTSDPGVGVRGATLRVRKQTAAAAVTDDTGRARVEVSGTEGERVDVEVVCPAGYQSPEERSSLTIRKLSEGSREPNFAVRCAPLYRSVVVGIRTENGQNLPVVHLGKQVGQTDASGAAHVLLTVKPGEQVTLLLDTQSMVASSSPKPSQSATASSERRPRVRPENPTLTFRAPDRNELVLLEQKFVVEPEKKPVYVGPRLAGPRRI